MRRALGTLGILVAPAIVEAATVERGPYLQMASPTAMTVRWRTDVETDTVIRYGSFPNALERSATGDITTDHELRLTGLVPGERYYYAVGDADGPLTADATTFFEMPPEAGMDEPVRIWVVGDSGSGNDDARAVYQRYLEHTGDTYTDAWLMLGDNADDSGNDDEYQTAVFDVYAELLRQTPLWPTLGDRDGSSSDSESQSGPYYDIFTLPRRAEAGGTPSGTEAYYSFDLANIHFVVLDSHDTDRAPGSPMLSWLEDDLQSTTQDWLVAFWHHPAYTKGAQDSDAELRSVEMRENALPLLERYGVDLVLAAHSQSYERSFLLDGHYGRSSELKEEPMVVDGGSGRVTQDGAYTKPTAGLGSHEGAIHVVAGSSGTVRPGTMSHPVMLVSAQRLGSLVLDVQGLRLNAAFLDARGHIGDHFTIDKGLRACSAIDASESGCRDGLDDDCDGMTDATDPDCIVDGPGGRLRITDIEDAFVDEAAPSTPFGDAPTWQVDTFPNQKESFVRPTSLGGLAPGSRVIHAELVLNVFNVGNAVEAREVTGAWEASTVTHATRPPSGGRVLGAFPGERGEQRIDVTGLFQSWVDGAPLWGIHLVPTGPDGVDGYAAQAATAHLRPAFEVVFAEPPCQPAPERCDDGTDDDCDGLVDCDDADCASDAACDEASASDTSGSSLPPPPRGDAPLRAADCGCASSRPVPGLGLVVLVWLAWRRRGADSCRVDESTGEA